VNDALRVVVADDERPARSFLISLLRAIEDVEVVGEAEDGREAIALIEGQRPDLAILDLQMPEIDGLGVVRLLKKNSLPLIAFATAYDEHAVRAFELNAVDYLLKPVDRGRLCDTVQRARERLEQAALVQESADRALAASVAMAESARPAILERIPVRQKDDIVILPVREIASILAEGDWLRLTTSKNESFMLSHRLKDLEARLDPAMFVRLGRGTLANLEMLERISPMPGGAYLATLSNGQQLTISRSQGRVLRDQLLRL
jgi:two-component system LytT family response regulator